MSLERYPHWDNTELALDLQRRVVLSSEPVSDKSLKYAAEAQRIDVHMSPSNWSKEENRVFNH